MKSINLNRIILLIEDKKAYESFRQTGDERVLSRILTYNDGMYPFADSLYICDTPEGCRMLLEKGYPVAALLHENNASSSFDHVGYLLQDPEQISLEDYDHIFRRLSGLPVEILETKRLLLRETALTDLDSFYEMYEDPEIAGFMEPLYPRDEEEAYQINYMKNVYAFYGIGIWTVILKENDDVIGRIGIEYTDEAGCVELGFMINAENRRKGYAYEACSAIVDYARAAEDITKIRARVREDNTPSQNLCAKLNMIQGKELNDGLSEWTLDL
ncbi:MAG: GNAT family N-acetyltransferase [Lachnospiraceae bacterium]|nr:GNAT family N-acetyltransferase [Lachnospiraceae bacterium]